MKSDLEECASDSLTDARLMYAIHKTPEKAMATMSQTVGELLAITK